jgi:hypothetical protein
VHCRELASPIEQALQLLEPPRGLQVPTPRAGFADQPEFEHDRIAVGAMERIHAALRASYRLQQRRLALLGRPDTRGTREREHERQPADLLQRPPRSPLRCLYTSMRALLRRGRVGMA